MYLHCSICLEFPYTEVAWYLYFDSLHTTSDSVPLMGCLLCKCWLTVLVMLMLIFMSTSLSDASVRFVSLSVMTSTVGSARTASSTYPNTLNRRKLPHFTPVPLLSTVYTSWSSANMESTGDIISPCITPLLTLKLPEYTYFQSVSRTLTITATAL